MTCPSAPSLPIALPVGIPGCCDDILTCCTTVLYAYITGCPLFTGSFGSAASTPVGGGCQWNWSASPVTISITLDAGGGYTLVWMVGSDVVTPAAFNMSCVGGVVYGTATGIWPALGAIGYVCAGQPYTITFSTSPYPPP